MLELSMLVLFQFSCKIQPRRVLRKHLDSRVVIIRCHLQKRPSIHVACIHLRGSGSFFARIRTESRKGLLRKHLIACHVLCVCVCLCAGAGAGAGACTVPNAQMCAYMFFLTTQDIFSACPTLRQVGAPYLHQTWTTSRGCGRLKDWGWDWTWG